MACCVTQSIERSITIDQVVQQAETGDLFLFDRNGANCFQQCVTGSVWVHVGIVIELPGRRSTTKYLCEAMMPKVVLTPLVKAVETWMDDESLLHMAFRKLQNVDRSKDALIRVAKLATTKYQNKPYETNMASSFSGAILHQSRRCSYCCHKELTDEDKEDELQALFCSELVAAIYIDAGWLNDTLAASRYLPKDFGIGGNENLTERLTNGATLGPLHQVVDSAQVQSINPIAKSVDDGNDDHEDLEDRELHAAVKESKKVPKNVHRYGHRLNKHDGPKITGDGKMSAKPVQGSNITTM